MAVQIVVAINTFFMFFLLFVKLLFLSSLSFYLLSLANTINNFTFRFVHGEVSDNFFERAAYGFFVYLRYFT